MIGSSVQPAAMSAAQCTPGCRARSRHNVLLHGEPSLRELRQRILQGREPQQGMAVERGCPCPWELKPDLESFARDGLHPDERGSGAEHIPELVLQHSANGQGGDCWSVMIMKARARREAWWSNPGRERLELQVAATTHSHAQPSPQSSARHP